MKKKNRTLLRNTLRTSLRTKGRLLSIFGIIAISTGFFAGLKVTSPNMKDSAEQYYQDSALMDLHMLSTVGFCQEELDLLANRGEIAELYGGWSEVAYMPVTDSASHEIVQIYSLPTAGIKTGAEINQPVLTEGRMPKTENECLIEVNTPRVYRVGDQIPVICVDPDTSLLKVQEFKAVGRADWAMYTDFERGTTTIGNGSVDSFLLVMPEAFDSDVYTDVFLTLNDTQGINSFTDRYLELAESDADALLSDKNILSAPRAAALKADAETALAESRAELDDGWTAYHTGIDGLDDAFADAKAALQKTETELSAAKSVLDEAQAEYDAAAAEIAEKREQLDQRERTITAQGTAASGALTEAEEQIETIDRGLALISGYRGSTVTEPFTDDINKIIEELDAFSSEEFDVKASMTKFFTAPVNSDEKESLENTIEFYLNNCKIELQNQVTQTETDAQQVRISRSGLEAARKEVEHGETALAESAEELAAQTAEYDAAKAEYDAAAEALAAEEQAQRDQLAEALADLEAGEEEYEAASAEIDNISEKIKWYVMTRSANPGWNSYGEDADRVDRIARIFPIFFIMVAALVCLTTMTRMIEEQRTEIGTYKALGYSAGAISLQFMLYAVPAAILGTAVGTAIGFQVFPRVIFKCYEMMYHYPPIHCPYHWGYALGCLAAALACTGITGLIACSATLREVPAKLMRPKPPKKGKRILLEKWKWFWSKCSFNGKITLRNFFRYRSRALMTIIGICGCTALLVTGFGLYHAIAAIVDLHFGEVFVYDMFGLYEEHEGHEQTLEKTLSEMPEISEFTFGMMRSATVTANGHSYEVTVTVPEEPEDFGTYIHMRNRKTQETLSLENDSVILNEKLANLLEVSPGDSIMLEGAAQAVTVGAVMENYVFNRVLMTPETCEALFGSYDTNCFYANLNANAAEDTTAEKILSAEQLLGLEFTSQSGGNFRKLVRALGYVVVLIIVSSGLLAFVVLYNLANINILERQRELATIKVLGFYDSEVYSYIFRENILSSTVGMLAGLIGGIFLCRYVVRTAEVDVVMFAPDIPWYCFLAAAAVTMLFTLLVNLLLRKKLRAIDMACSMKAIE